MFGYRYDNLKRKLEPMNKKFKTLKDDLESNHRPLTENGTIELCQQIILDNKRIFEENLRIIQQNHKILDQNKKALDFIDQIIIKGKPNEKIN
ncbi:hypothetical protein BpHYR1_051596 [Brachionus plicatilis]|uniref:Uncharacterized protein n=1 Tax=Brachionus plicatilis TaxID=10195 RepID=A0A3M7R2M4_BRAPC|nr:hypothetical protein BpHYR1_051596 [Brachionus plicatilis]